MNSRSVKSSNLNSEVVKHYEAELYTKMMKDLRWCRRHSLNRWHFAVSAPELHKKPT